jgi:hypothetical protein
MCFRSVARSHSGRFGTRGRGSHGAKPNATREVVEMLDKQARGAILVLSRKVHSLHRMSQLLSLSRNSVKKVIKIGSDVPPVIHRLRKLDAHHELIAQMLAEFDGSVVKVCRALSDAGTSVGYSTLTRFCRKNHLLDGARAPRHSVMATREWLLELARRTYAGERFQSQLPHTTDLQFLLSLQLDPQSLWFSSVGSVPIAARGLRHKADPTHVTQALSTRGGRLRYCELRHEIMQQTECSKRTAQLAISEACKQGAIVHNDGQYRLPL